jgi:hypothetical protein
MKIYKLTEQQFFDFHSNTRGLQDSSLLNYDIHDYYEDYQNNLSEIIDDFLNGQSLSWSPVKLDRLKPVYSHFTKRNFLDPRDIKSLHNIIRDIGNNISRLRATTDLALHGQESLENLFENSGYEPLDEDQEDEFFNFLDWQGKDPISDYGLTKLESLLSEIMNSNDTIKQLTLLNQLLQIVHMRNDLASFLIEGGTESLLELSSLEI